jgi:hypothetical protein
MRYFLFISLILCSFCAFAQKWNTTRSMRPMAHGTANNFGDRDVEDMSVAMKFGIVGFTLLFIVWVRYAWREARRSGGWFSGSGYHQQYGSRGNRLGGTQSFSSSNASSSGSNSGSISGAGASGSWLDQRQ